MSVADIAHHDFNTFPREDPAAVKTRKKEVDKLEKERKEMSKPSAVAKKLGRPRKTKAAVAVHEDAELERAILLRKCNQYFSKLGHKITMRKPHSMPSDVESLRKLVADIETDLASSGGVEAASSMYVMGVDLLEKFSPMLPGDIKLHGPAASLTSTILANKEKWDDLITEVAIQHCEWFMVSGLKRLVYTTVSMANAVNQANHAALQNRAEAAPSEELQQRGQEL